MSEGIAYVGYFEQLYRERDWRWYGGVLGSVLRYGEPGPILDIGAGHGLFVECARRWGLECEGIEGSEEGTRLAAKRGIILRLGLLSDPLPWPDHTFQTVTGYQVIEHLDPDTQRIAVTEAHRVLRPGGLLFIASPSRFNRYERTADATHIGLLSPTELHDLLAAAGFIQIKALDTALPRLGFLFRHTHWERLSATANAVGYKP